MWACPFQIGDVVRIKGAWMCGEIKAVDEQAVLVQFPVPNSPPYWYCSRQLDLVEVAQRRPSHAVAVAFLGDDRPAPTPITTVEGRDRDARQTFYLLYIIGLLREAGWLA